MMLPGFTINQPSALMCLCITKIMNRSSKISRRQFIKQSAASFLGFAATPHLLGEAARSKNEEILGRVLFYDVPTFEQPYDKAAQNGTHTFNDVLTMQQPTKGIPSQNNKNTWFPLENDAFIQSQNVQVVRNILNTPKDFIPNSGKLGEITVPLTQAIPATKQNTKPYQHFFYGSVHWVYGLGENPTTKKIYYLVIEDRWNESYYVEAAHMRIIEDEELAPISPVVNAEAKRILVDTNSQMLYAYEDQTLVMACGVSTGVIVNGTNLSTPPGEYFINYKRPTRHMVHSDKIGINDEELYGVPWVSYFTDTGIAFHGTYWHNDYTQPRSHGCVNMPIPAAKWLYLWSDPIIDPRAKKHTSRYGTTVQVI